MYPHWISSNSFIYQQTGFWSNIQLMSSLIYKTQRTWKDQHMWFTNACKMYTPSFSDFLLVIWYIFSWLFITALLYTVLFRYLKKSLKTHVQLCPISKTLIFCGNQHLNKFLFYPLKVICNALLLPHWLCLWLLKLNNRVDQRIKIEQSRPTIMLVEGSGLTLHNNDRISMQFHIFCFI